MFTAFPFLGLLYFLLFCFLPFFRGVGGFLFGVLYFFCFSFTVVFCFWGLLYLFFKQRWAISECKNRSECCSCVFFFFWVKILKTNFLKIYIYSGQLRWLDSKRVGLGQAKFSFYSHFYSLVYIFFELFKPAHRALPILTTLLFSNQKKNHSFSHKK